MASIVPNCLPLLIGSLPLSDHRQAVELIFAHTSEIPIWPQLPSLPQEGMIDQILPGFPGLAEVDGKTFIDTEGPDFDQQFLAFFEEYLMITEGGADLDQSRFALTPVEAKGFFEFLQLAAVNKAELVALKGQMTGPITFCTGVVDGAGRAIFYNDQLRDAAIKMLALKAQWQVRQMNAICAPSILFFDEPGLAGFGSSAFITITKEDVIASLAEVFAAVKAENGITGVHVCANTEWSMLFSAGVDVLSYDAYSFFDKLLLYPDHLRRFMNEGGILATGIIPTAGEFIDGANAPDLVNLWLSQTAQLEAIGIPRQTIVAQTFITPSCGTGAVTEAQARKVLALTRDVSAEIRRRCLA